MQGANILDPNALPMDAVIETDYRYYTFLRALREDSEPRWKLIRNLETGAEELFDLSQDPEEQHNRHQAAPAKASSMAERLLSQ